MSSEILVAAIVCPVLVIAGLAIGFLLLKIQGE